MVRRQVLFESSRSRFQWDLSGFFEDALSSVDVLEERGKKNVYENSFVRFVWEMGAILFPYRCRYSLILFQYSRFSCE